MGSQLPLKGAQPPVFGHVYCGQTAGWTKTTLGTEVRSRPRPRPHCIKRGPSCPARKGHSSPPLFGPCLLWSRSPISATAELLLNSTDVTDRPTDHATPSIAIGRIASVAMRPNKHAIGQTIIFLPCGFILIFFFFSSPNLSRRTLNVYHTCAHGVAVVRI